VKVDNSTVDNSLLEAGLFSVEKFFDHYENSSIPQNSPRLFVMAHDGSGMEIIKESCVLPYMIKKKSDPSEKIFLSQVDERTCGAIFMSKKNRLTSIYSDSFIMSEKPFYTQRRIVRHKPISEYSEKIKGIIGKMEYVEKLKDLKLEESPNFNSEKIKTHVNALLEGESFLSKYINERARYEETSQIEKAIAPPVVLPRKPKASYLIQKNIKIRPIQILPSVETEDSYPPYFKTAEGRKFLEENPPAPKQEEAFPGKDDILDNNEIDVKKEPLVLEIIQPNSVGDQPIINISDSKQDIKIENNETVENNNSININEVAEKEIIDARAQAIENISDLKPKESSALSMVPDVKPKVEPNQKSIETEYPTKRILRTSSTFKNKTHGLFDVRPSIAKFGILRDGSSYLLSIFLTNVGCESIRYKIIKPKYPSIQINYDPGLVAAGMKVKVDLVLTAHIQGNVDEYMINDTFKIKSEWEIITIHLQATVYSTKKYDFFLVETDPNKTLHLPRVIQLN
jgi:hypothetical protein